MTPQHMTNQQNHMRSAVLGAIAFVVITAWTQTCLAFTARSGSYSVREGEVLRSDLVFIGDTLRIDGKVLGDVIAISQEIQVSKTGRVEGDVIAAAEKLYVAGICADDIRAISDDMRLSGRIERSFSFFGNSVQFKPESSIGRDASILGIGCKLDGLIAGRLGGGIDELSIDGTIGGGVDIEVVRLVVGSNSDISGGLVYRGPQRGQIASEARIKGIQDWTRRERFEDKPSWPIIEALGKLAAGLMSVAFGLFAIALLPGPFRRYTEIDGEETGRLILVGAAILFLYPFIALALGFTVIGIPVAVFMLAAYLLLLAVAWTTAVLCLARLAAAALGWRLHDLLLFLLGSLVIVPVSLFGAVSIPLHMLLLAFGFGLVLSKVKRSI